jgi:hypothetical protein
VGTEPLRGDRNDWNTEMRKGGKERKNIGKMRGEEKIRRKKRIEDDKRGKKKEE